MLRRGHTWPSTGEDLGEVPAPLTGRPPPALIYARTRVVKQPHADLVVARLGDERKIPT
jgi:hypothetical protein